MPAKCDRCGVETDFEASFFKARKSFPKLIVRRGNADKFPPFFRPRPATAFIGFRRDRSTLQATATSKNRIRYTATSPL